MSGRAVAVEAWTLEAILENTVRLVLALKPLKNGLCVLTATRGGGRKQDARCDVLGMPQKAAQEVIPMRARDTLVQEGSAQLLNVLSGMSKMLLG